MAGADTITNRIGGFSGFCQAIKFRANRRCEVGEPGKIEERFGELDELVPAMRQSPICETATPMRCADGGETCDRFRHGWVRYDETAGIDSSHAVGEQMDLLGIRLFLDLHDLGSEFHGALRCPFGVAQGGVEDLVAVALQMGLDIPKIVAAILGVAISFREHLAIALMEPVKPGDTVDEDNRIAGHRVQYEGLLLIWPDRTSKLPTDAGD